MPDPKELLAAYDSQLRVTVPDPLRTSPHQCRHAPWVRFQRGTEFATFWGGATLKASDSRPILERLGFGPVTTTTPYVWSPSLG